MMRNAEVVQNNTPWRFPGGVSGRDELFNKALLPSSDSGTLGLHFCPDKGYLSQPLGLQL